MVREQKRAHGAGRLRRPEAPPRAAGRRPPPGPSARGRGARRVPTGDLWRGAAPLPGREPTGGLPRSRTAGGRPVITLLRLDQGGGEPQGEDGGAGRSRGRRPRRRSARQSLEPLRRGPPRGMGGLRGCAAAAGPTRVRSDAARPGPWCSMPWRRIPPRGRRSRSESLGFEAIYTRVRFLCYRVQLSCSNQSDSVV